MRKLKSTIPNGGAPLLEFPVFGQLFDDDTKDYLQAILKSVNDLAGASAFIVTGCEITDNGADYDVSAGIVMIDGVMRRYDGETGLTGTRYIVASTDTELSGQFADGVTKAYADVKEAEGSASAGSGQSIELTATANPVRLYQFFNVADDPNNVGTNKHQIVRTVSTIVSGTVSTSTFTFALSETGLTNTEAVSIIEMTLTALNVGNVVTQFSGTFTYDSVAEEFEIDAGFALAGYSDFRFTARYIA